MRKGETGNRRQNIEKGKEETGRSEEERVDSKEKRVLGNKVTG